MSRHIGRLCLGLFGSALISTVTFGQWYVVENGGPLSSPPPLNAPFSADATTTVLHRLKNGTRVERKMTARYYRDAGGRVRVEHTGSANPSRDVRITIFPDPASNGGYLLEPSSRHARFLGRSIEDLAVGGGIDFAVRIGAFEFINFTRSPAAYLESIGPRVADPVSEEALGNRQISGVETTGRRVTSVVPVGALGNDKPIAIVDERWESLELRLLIYSRFSNSRTADVEYLVTNIRRLEPLPELFEVPVDYTFWNVLDTKNPLEAFFPPEHPEVQAR